MLTVQNFQSLEKIKTPFYYYDIDLLSRTLTYMKSMSEKYNVVFHYAMKANSEPRIASMIAAAGFGADCVSGNEVLAAASFGFKPGSIMFAGVGKTDKEIHDALQTGIGCFNVESIPELEVIDQIASEMGVIAPIAFRINPNVDAHTHKYITTGLDENKFGVSDYEFDSAIEALSKCSSVKLKGLQFHVGSQITDIDGVFTLECEKVKEIAAYFESKGVQIDNIDLGGGLGVSYEQPDDYPVADFESWVKIIRESFGEDCKYTLHIEPGRAVVAQCGTVITKALYVKHGRRKDFLILDAGMNDLIRPALYGSYHKIENLSAYYLRNNAAEDHKYDVVGPVCESSDVWGEDRLLPDSGRGDLIAIRTAGAYGQVMASRYNLKDLAVAVYSDEIK